MLRELDVPPPSCRSSWCRVVPLLRNPSSHELLDALGLAGAGRHRSARVCDLLVVERGPAAWRPRCTAHPKGWRRPWPRTPRWAARRGPRPGSRTFWASRGPVRRGADGAAALQAQKFGVRIKLARERCRCPPTAGTHQVSFDDGEVVTAKSVIIATGARYNRLPLDRLAEFEGVGVYYAATQMEAQACREARSSSSAAATLPARPRCSSAAAAPRFTSSSEASRSDTPCRAT